MDSLGDMLAELGFEDEPKTQLVELPKPGSAQEKLMHREELRSIEDGLLKASMGVVDAALAFRDIDPEDEGVPDEWVKRYGMVEAIKRHRIARACWAPASKAPIGVVLAQKLMVGIVKARAAESDGPRELNLTMVQMTAPMPTFPVIDVRPEDD
jgi:hypothetical protein